MFSLIFDFEFAYAAYVQSTFLLSSCETMFLMSGANAELGKRSR